MNLSGLNEPEKPAKDDMKVPEAIFFDFGDTLVETEPLYLERLRLSFNAEGIPVTYAGIEKAYIEGDWRSARALIGRDPFPVEAWQELYMAVMLETLGIKENAKEVLSRVADRMAEIRPTRKLVEGAAELLEKCASRGIAMAVLSNNDGRTAQKAEEAGIAGYFSFVMDSTLEKTTKPGAKFFEKALELAKLEPGDCLHVGDLLGCDVMGAQNVGIPAVWFHAREYMPHAPVTPEAKVGSFAELGELLGLEAG